MSARTPNVLALMLGLALVSSPALAQQQEHVMSTTYTELSPGGTLDVDVPDADILLLTGADDRVQIDVYLVAGDLERARERYERMRMRAHLDGAANRVSLQADEVPWHWSWRDWGRFEVRVEIRLPERFDLDVRTEDGDITAGSHQGRLVLLTEDGDIAAERLEGEVRLVTSDGDIRTGSISGGVVEVRTSDGDVVLGAVSATEIVLESSDGDIVADVAAADRVEARTSDGDISLRGVRGALSAATHDGDIDIDVDQVAELALQSGDGDVALSLPQSAAADLDLRGGEISFRSGSGFDGRIERRSVVGTLNGGGPAVRVRSGDGSVSLRLRESR